MPLRLTRACLVSGLALLAACSRDEPTAPEVFSITGHLRLTGYLVDTNGAYAGTKVLGDADGVTVELLHGTEVVARTITVDGVYRFDSLRPGGYVARSRVVGNIGDQTSSLVIAVEDVVAADTIRLVSHGDLRPVPNPFVDTLQVHFAVPDTTWVDVDVLDVGGNPIRNLLSLEVLPMEHAVFWYGRNQQNQPVAGSLFWVTYVAANDVRACLLFR
jgi:hypothetical protein